MNTDENRPPIENRPLILVVDDYEENRLLLRLFLKHRGYDVIEAENGSEAVKAAIQHRPDLILMDISMPLLDGCAAMRLIRGNDATRHVPIIAMSAHEYEKLDPLLRLDAMLAGLTEYVTKPFNPLELERVIERLLPPKQPTQENVSLPGGVIPDAHLL